MPLLLLQLTQIERCFKVAINLYDLVMLRLSLLRSQARCKDLQKVVPTLAELEELDAQAQELPGVVLDMDNLSRYEDHNRRLPCTVYACLDYPVLQLSCPWMKIKPPILFVEQ